MSDDPMQGWYVRDDRTVSFRRFIAAADGRVEQVDRQDEERGAIPILEIEYLIRTQTFELGH